MSASFSIGGEIVAKVIQTFREKYHDDKIYYIGQDYPEDDKERVKYLVKQGFLDAVIEEEPENHKKRRKKDVNSDGDSDA